MSDTDFVVAIPARYGSTRLPGKALRPIAGVPMVVRVANRALEAGATRVVVATDDERIRAAIGAISASVCMTRQDHASGTDRLAECSRMLEWPDSQVVVNLQGDEPFAPPQGIRAVVRTLLESGADMATLATAIVSSREMFDPAVVKVVRSDRGDALYFSRAPIPWDRDRFQRDRVSPPAEGCLRHIGIYAYRAGFLRRVSDMPPGRLELVESLEQLRVLEAGFRIAVGISPVPFPPGVDTEEDLARAELLATSGGNG